MPDQQVYDGYFCYDSPDVPLNLHPFPASAETVTSVKKNCNDSSGTSYQKILKFEK